MSKSPEIRGNDAADPAETEFMPDPFLDGELELVEVPVEVRQGMNSGAVERLGGMITARTLEEGEI